MLLRFFKSNIFSNYKFWIFIVFLYYFVCSFIYGLAALVKHSHFETFVDLAVFNQGIWQYSQLKLPFITLHLNRFFLGDHFHPILVLLAPLYWIFPSEKSLLFVQPFILLSAMVPIFLIGVRKTSSYFFSFCIIFAYSFYIPLQYALFYDFHEIIFLPTLFAWAYYFHLQNKKSLVFVFLFLCLLIKEEIGFFVATFGLYLLIFEKGWRRFGGVWISIGITYSLLMIYIVIPKIGGSYLYFNYGNSGNTPIEVVANFFKNPFYFLRLFFGSSVKIETLYRTFWPFAFLPLLSPLGFLLSLEQFFSRFIDLKTITRWTIGYHYSIPMTIVVALSSILSADFLTRYLKNKKAFLIILGIIILYLTRIEQINASAILLIKNPAFWQRAEWMDDIDKAISLVPKDASIASQNNIIAHISTRKSVFLLKDINKAEYILADFHPGQPDYNFFGADEKKESFKRLNEKIESGKYEIIYKNKQTFLIKKI
jgi:uncharacterized membrane protein